MNARELGGYPVAGGRETSWGAIVRADTLVSLMQAGQNALVAYGIRTIVDLRLAHEGDQSPHPFIQAGSRGIVYISAPLNGPEDTASADFTTMADQYKRVLERGQAAVAAILTVIARALEGGVLVHCTYGKDRAGLISALVLDLVGVPRQTIAEDYALTAECLRPLVEQFLERGPGERADRERELERWLPYPAVILAALEYLDGRFGGVEDYLLQAGMTATDVTRLRQRLLPDTP